MKINNKYFKYGIFSVILIIIVPIFVDFLIIGNNLPSNIKNTDWTVFLGSYIGALIGSITTLIGVIITLNFTREETNENRRLSLVPYLVYFMHEKRLETKHDIHILHIVDKNENTYVNTTVSIKNLGMGPLLNLRIYNMSYNKKSLDNNELSSQNSILEKDSEWLMLIDLRIRLDEIKNETLIKTPPGSLTEYVPPLDIKGNGILSFNIGYEDLIGNKYEQDIEITMLIGCENKPNRIEWEYSTPELRLSKIGESRIIGKKSRIVN